MTPNSLSVTSFKAQHAQDFFVKLKDSTGVVTLTNLSTGKPLCLHVVQGKITSVFMAGRPLRDAEQARQSVLDAVNQRTAAFAFEAMPDDALRKGLCLCLWDSVGMTQPLDFRAADNCQVAMPAPEQRFVLQDSGDLMQCISRSEFIQDAWNAMEPLLRRGVSALELSQTLGITLGQARIRLYRLQTMHVVQPL
ncbi:hypothetical protein ACFP81_13040 [Deinococcus lacus]|uniref:DUF4388 domain-containing protein n=1 Tax=Deinococcus lacus TaxID=392561 RepID=A0ABW1YEZ4_9DEIO